MTFVEGDGQTGVEVGHDPKNDEPFTDVVASLWFCTRAGIPGSWTKLA
ncbi:hypothetical protein [Nocardia sp. NBC_00416]